MRTDRLLSVLLIAILAADLRAAVRIAESRPRLVRLDNVQAWCGSAGKNACTIFLVRDLTARCAPAGDAWAMRADVLVVPHVILAQPAALTHELMHIEDIRRSLESYVDEIGARSYATEDRCRAEAEFEENGFADAFKRFAQESQKRLH